MTQKGTHTWDLILQYHLCPACGHIIESRQDYQYKAGAWTKSVECDKCSHHFTVTKKQKLTFGPLIGEPQPPEVTWQ